MFKTKSVDFFGSDLSWSVIKMCRIFFILNLYTTFFVFSMPHVVLVWYFEAFLHIILKFRLCKRKLLLLYQMQDTMDH